MARREAGDEARLVAAVLQRLGVDSGQGFLLARPAPAEEIRALFARPPAELRRLTIAT